jgi:hypothetical protein
MPMAVDILTPDQRDALRQFATFGIPVGEFLSRMTPLIQVGSFIAGEREISVTKRLSESVPVTRDDIKWVVQRYIRGKMSGEELSHWAGLLLGISAYVLPSADEDDDVLGLLADLALPLKNEYLDRDVLRQRVADMR